MANNGINSADIRRALKERGALPPELEVAPKKPNPNRERDWLDAWLMNGGEEPKRQFKFHPTRKWMFDFAFPDVKVAVEYQGGIWSGGGHTRGRQYAKDRYKLWTAQSMGWIVCEVTDHKDCGLMDEIKVQIELRKGRYEAS